MLPFGFTIASHIELFGYNVEVDFSLTYWALHFRHSPDKGLTLLTKVGPIGLYIYDVKKQNEWLNRLVSLDDIKALSKENGDE
jgi:hypothetical protein